MFLITPRLAGTRTAAAQSTLGAVRAGATPTGPSAPEPAPRVIQTQTPAPAPAPGTVQVQAPAQGGVPQAAAPVPAGPAPAQAAAPAPALRRSVVVDLDALPATTRSIAAALRDDPTAAACSNWSEPHSERLQPMPVTA